MKTLISFFTGFSELDKKPDKRSAGGAAPAPEGPYSYFGKTYFSLTYFGPRYFG